MKTIVSLIVVVLMIGAQTAYADTEYQAGFKRGVSDAYFDNANLSRLDWVNQPGNSLDNHSHNFGQGYVKGWCSIMGPDTGKETDNAVFDCEKRLS